MLGQIGKVAFARNDSDNHTVSRRKGVRAEPEARSFLRAVCGPASPAKDMLLNLSGLKHLTRGGVGAVVRLYRHLEDNGRHLVISQPSPVEPGMTTKSGRRSGYAFIPSDIRSLEYGI